MERHKGSIVRRPRNAAQIQRSLLHHIREMRLQPGDRLPTVLEFARHLRVSTHTVQKAIHALRSDGLIEAKRKKGIYVARGIAANLRSRRVGLVFPANRSYLEGRPYPKEVINAFQSEMKRNGFTIVPCPLGEWDPLSAMDRLHRMKLRGLALFELDSNRLISEIQELRRPMVSMDFNAYPLGVPSIVFDNLVGMFDITRHLIGLGHRRIVLMCKLYRNPFGHTHYLDAVINDRVQGYRLAMHGAGLCGEVAEYTQSEADLPETLLKLFQRKAPPTALACVSDGAGAAVARRAIKLGLRIPEDVSVTGFGDYPVEINGSTHPGLCLTSVWIDRKGMGRAAAELFIESLGETHNGPQLRILPTKLAIHESAATPPRAARRIHECETERSNQ